MRNVKRMGSDEDIHRQLDRLDDDMASARAYELLRKPKDNLVIGFIFLCIFLFASIAVVVDHLFPSSMTAYECARACVPRHMSHYSADSCECTD